MAKKKVKRLKEKTDHIHGDDMGGFIEPPKIDIEAIKRKHDEEMEELKSRLTFKDKEIEGHKQSIKNLENDKEKLSARVASKMPGQEKRIFKGNLLEKLMKSGQKKMAIYDIIHKSTNKASADKALEIMEKLDYKPTITDREKKEVETMKKERETAIKTKAEDDLKKAKQL